MTEDQFTQLMEVLSHWVNTLWWVAFWIAIASFTFSTGQD